jgi:SAM-dependent methyltransferase
VTGGSKKTPLLPSAWLLANADILPRSGRALDVACGPGRHALRLAADGLNVTAIDRDPAKIAKLQASASRLGLALEARVMDLEAERVDIGTDAYDLVLVVHYLHRPLVPALRRALVPGGLLLYETFTTEQASRGKPKSPEHLLEPGELLRLVAPLEVLRQREGEFEGRFVASVVARRPN